MRVVKNGYRDGEERIVSFFAFSPVTIQHNGKFETRWMERVTVRQKFEVLGFDREWHNVEFVDGTASL